MFHNLTVVNTAEWIQYRAQLPVHITPLLCNAPPASTTRLFFLSVLESRLQPPAATPQPPPPAPPPLPPASPLHQTVKCITCSKRGRKKNQNPGRL